MKFVQDGVYQETEYYPEYMDDPFADTLLDFETPLRRSQALLKSPASGCKTKCKKVKHLKKSKKAADKATKAATETPAPKPNIRLTGKTSPSEMVAEPDQVLVSDQLPLPPMLPTDVQPQGPRKGRLSYTVRSSNSSAVVEAYCMCLATHPVCC